MSYVHDRVARDFTVIDFVPGGEQSDFLHDVHLLRKPVTRGTDNGA